MLDKLERYVDKRVNYLLDNNGKYFLHSLRLHIMINIIHALLLGDFKFARTVDNPLR